MNNTVPIGGRGLEARPGGPGMRMKSPFHGGKTDILFQRLGDAADALNSHSVHDLLRKAVQPIAPTLTRTLRDLAYSYVPAQGLGGSVHFDAVLPEIDVPEGPLRAILEHLVEGALRGNPSVKPFCHVGVVQDTDEKVVLAIRDNGTPLPECGMEDLRRFLRDTEPRHVPDRVHRLFLADNLVQWLGGAVRIAPTPGADGTTVLVEIPRAANRLSDAPTLVGRHVF